MPHEVVANEGDVQTLPHPAAPPIRSFVRRAGRVSNAQGRYFAELMPSIGIPFAPRPLDLNASFARPAPKILEIGCGMGETTARIAASNPDNDYLGIEVHLPGLGNLCKCIAEQGLANIRLINHDAVEVVRQMIPEGALAGVHIFFPDPWPKKRHHKRRLLQAPFVELLSSRLAVGGYLHVATDWQEYAEQILAVLSAEASLQNTAPDYVERPQQRPLTKFEQRGQRLGHGVWDLIFRRVAVGRG